MNILNETISEALARWTWGPVASEVSGNGDIQSITAAELEKRIDTLAAILAYHGVRSGVIVAIFLSNGIDFIAVLFALFRIGAVPVIGKMEYRALELTEIFANANPAVVVTESDGLGALTPFLAGRTVLRTDAGSLATVQLGPDKLVPGEFDAVPASINYTYRGLGYPLGAMISAEQYLHGARVLQEGLQGDPGEPLLFAIPMTHIFTLIGCIFVPLLYGMPMVIARTVHPRRTFDTIERLQVGHITAVPELYRLMLRTRDPDRTLGSLKTFVSGGSFLADEEYHALGEAFDIEVLHGYGLTEFTPASRNSRRESRPGTIGPLCDGVECRIAGENGSGEILIRTDTMRMEYYRRPVESAAAQKDGWFCTGDAGRFSNGHLVFERELKRTCKVNGLLVDLPEVESATQSVPGVRSASVSLVDGVLSARVSVEGNDDPRELNRSIRDFLKNKIAAYKIPQVNNVE